MTPYKAMFPLSYRPLTGPHFLRVPCNSAVLVTKPLTFEGQLVKPSHSLCWKQWLKIQSRYHSVSGIEGRGASRRVQGQTGAPGDVLTGSTTQSKSSSRSGIQGLFPNMTSTCFPVPHTPSPQRWRNPPWGGPQAPGWWKEKDITQLSRAVREWWACQRSVMGTGRDFRAGERHLMPEGKTCGNFGIYCCGGRTWQSPCPSRYELCVNGPKILKANIDSRS